MLFLRPSLEGTLSGGRKISRLEAERRFDNLKHKNSDTIDENAHALELSLARNLKWNIILVIIPVRARFRSYNGTKTLT